MIQLTEMRSKPQQKRSQEKVEAILMAVGDLLVTKDFSDISISDIANMANIPTSALYRYFTDKYDVLAALAQQVFAAEDGDIKRAFLAATNHAEMLQAVERSIDIDLAHHLSTERQRRLILAFLTTPEIRHVLDRSSRQIFLILIQATLSLHPQLTVDDATVRTQTAITMYVSLGRAVFEEPNAERRALLIKEWKRAQLAYARSIFELAC